MNRIAFLSLSLIFVLSSCGMFQNSGKLSFRKVEQSEKEVKSKRFSSDNDELDLAQSQIVQSEKREEALVAHVEDDKKDKPNVIKSQNSKKFTAQNFSTDFKPVKQVIQQGKKVTKKLSPRPSEGGVKKALFFIVVAILLALLGAVFYYNLGVFGMILGIVFYIGAAIYLLIGIIMLIAG